MYVLAGIGECRDYGSIPNGERIIEGTREGNIVIFRCNEDFDLLGNRQLVCGSDGYWSAAWPVCRKCEIHSPSSYILIASSLAMLILSPFFPCGEANSSSIWPARLDNL